jgi:hypothetical protein
MSWSPLFTDEELAELARPPRELLAMHLADGSVEAAITCLGHLDTALSGQMVRYRHWLGELVRLEVERRGEAGAIALVDATRALLAVHPDVQLAGQHDPESFVTALSGLVAACGGGSTVAEALAAFDALVDRWRATVDLHRDWISALLSAVYRDGGPHALEAAHRAVGEATMDGLLADLATPARDRLERFAWLLKGHFSSLSIEEAEDRFVIRQDPCGTCGRQARDGRYDPPFDLAVVDDRSTLTWGRGPTTIYRTHVPVWHVTMACERIGVPWPVNQCPPGVDGSSCTIVLFKDPLDPAAAGLVPGHVLPVPCEGST